MTFFIVTRMIAWVAKGIAKLVASGTAITFLVIVVVSIGSWIDQMEIAKWVISAVALAIAIAMIFDAARSKCREFRREYESENRIV